jgi:DNA helicase-2/ATP-dependent DNA helicase PcrA
MLDIQNHIDSLNDAQLEAVLHTEGPLLVLAGAGTGKTKVLTTRIANIIQQKLADPQSILAVTFTNKAAKEMGQRINNMINAYGLNIGTFHSIAAKILRSNIEALNLGLGSNYTIIDQDEQIKLIKDIAKQLNIDVKTYNPKILHVIISRWKDLGLLPSKISVSDVKSSIHKVARLLYQEYQKQLIASNALDFGDLLIYNNELLINNEGLLNYYQDKYKYILIDEYQDTNAVQYIWARMLASKYKNICCVGDDDQSIYSWRGAEVGNILRFEKDFPNSKIIKLEQNYRSSSEILAAASNLIVNNKSRHGKTLWTQRNSGEKIKIISCWNDREEARFVVAEIDKCVKEDKYKPNDIAILVRAGFQTRAFEEVFISNRIPYRIIGGLRFYDRMEIKDLLAYIRIILNNNDNIALDRIINVPKRAIGDTTLRQIKDYAKENGLSMLASIRQMLELNMFKSKVEDNLTKFINLIDKSRLRYESEPALNVTKAILEESGYLELLKIDNSDESRSRIENLNEMLRAIDEFNNIQEFIEHSSLVMEHETLESNFGGAVNVMTLHAAKGLEFDLVFLPGWEEGVFPHQKALSEDSGNGLEEERRIAYVGITRAKKDLYISFAESRKMFYEILRSTPSRFLAEIPDNVCIRISSTKQLSSIPPKYKSLEPKFEENICANISEGKAYSKTKVKHASFGVGVVLREQGDNLEIIFEGLSGIKTIKRSYVTAIE